MKFTLAKRCRRKLEKLDDKDIISFAKDLKIKGITNANSKHNINAVISHMAHSFYSLGYRHELRRLVVAELDKIVTKNTNYACIWGKKKILDIIQLGKRLGMGAFGAVDGGLIDIPDLDKKEPLVLKYLAIEEDNYTRITSGFRDTYPVNREILTHYYVNNLMKQNISPNFVFMWDWWICQKCKGIQTRKGGETKTMPDTECFITALEKFDGDTSGLARDKTLSKAEKADIFDGSFVFQVIHALATLQKYYGIDHNDAGLRNVLYKKIPKYIGKGITSTYWKYQIYGEVYYVPNNGYLFALSDYGLARSERLFGTRSDYTVVNDEHAITRVLTSKNKIEYESEDGLTSAQISKILSNPAEYHNRDRGVAIFARELSIYKLRNETVRKVVAGISDQLPKGVLDQKVRKTQPAIDYSVIFDDAFKEYRHKPKHGVCIGEYSADKKLSSKQTIDIEYVGYLKQFYE